MPQQQILELEVQLAAARETAAQLTKANAELTARLQDAERMLKKSRRSSRREATTMRTQITELQNRRG